MSNEDLDVFELLATLDHEAATHDPFDFLKSVSPDCDTLHGECRQDDVLLLPVSQDESDGSSTTTTTGCEADDGSVGEDEAQEDEHKCLKRMLRNRESAAASRNRKKQHVQRLETTIAELQESVCSLQKENTELRRERDLLLSKR